VAFNAMSDGYRQYIGWISDLLYHVCTGLLSGKKLVENRGIVLIDEIDLHLHPDWQRTVIGRMSETLPNLQFILTSHSPIVVGTLYKENVFVFEEDASGASVARPVQTEVHGLNADQVLTSSAFGLRSSRAPEFVAELKKMSTRAQKGDRNAESQFHRMLVYGAGANEMGRRIDKVPKEVRLASSRLNAQQKDTGTPAKRRTEATVPSLRKKPTPKAKAARAKKK
jgi:hypothetical protein